MSLFKDSVLVLMVIFLEFYYWFFLDYKKVNGECKNVPISEVISKINEIRENNNKEPLDENTFSEGFYLLNYIILFSCRNSWLI